MSRSSSLLRRSSTVLAGLLVALFAMAGPAFADPAGPTNFRSEIIGMTPDVDGVDLEVLGGDSFLLVRVDEGREVLIPGYDGEELYLRIDPDGRVFVNERSRTYFQNQERYGANPSEIPAEAGPDAPPDWVQVSSGGSYAWHDHRIHWMSPTTLPPAIDASSGEPQGYDWPEPIVIVVDGQPVAVDGRMTWYPDTTPVTALLAAVIGLVAVLVLGWRDPALGVVGGVGGASLVALAVAVPANIGLAAGVAAQPIQLILPAVAILALIAGHLMRDRSPFAYAVAGAGGLTLIAWGLTQVSAITAPVLPSGPESLVRLAVGFTIGAGLAAFVVGVRTVLTPEGADTAGDGGEPAATG